MLGQNKGKRREIAIPPRKQKNTRQNHSLNFSLFVSRPNSPLTQPKAKTPLNKKKIKEKTRRKEEERRKKEDEGKASISTFKDIIKTKSNMCMLPFLR